MNFLLLIIIPLVILFIFNRLFGNLIGSMMQGVVSYIVGFLIVKFLGLEENISGLQLILTGFGQLLILNFYSRSQDSSDGPSEIRSEIQGVGVWMAVTAVILAILN